MEIKNLKYFNEYGGFSEDGKEYTIRINKNVTLPTVWSHVLANKKFGTIVTNNMGGYTWSKNCRLNRITSFANTPKDDVPSEIIYIKDMTEDKAWSLNANVMPDDEDYYITYGFGYAVYYHVSYGIVQECEVFVPKDDSLKINILRLKNTTSEKRNLKILYYIKPVLRRRGDEN